ncbi:nck-associated protein 5-like isoform X4 [Salvelinus fontinalis]|uniref:nck-associated protein 5-like isoform X4 n=1 Tax=Salvelinus fontinalis TaxID=8038 RepID=UPI0024861E2D|nr:nck-associated protein 5-like isoform X4 [Salvelinus fontinalis]
MPELLTFCVCICRYTRRHKKVVMESEEPELRECDEAFESDEGNVESYLEEPESSRELLERLKELEAENSTLALANESQREAYERCLDEVANHVVQALLNQKDLREECIKLKMRVFDLERQNKTLTELFAQKLHPQASHLQQLQLVSVSEHSTEPSTEPLTMDSDKLLVSKNQGGLKSNGDRTQNGSAASARATSMEALSPFFKKKAHILEVLRKLEESDPLKFHPSSCLSPHHDLGQALVSMERDQISLMSSEALPAPQPPVAHPSSRCHHSSSDSDIRDYANGEGALQEDHAQHQQQQHGGCQSCHILSQKSSLDSLLKCAQGHGASHQARVEILNRQACAEDQGALAQSTSPPQAAALSHLLSADSTNQCYMHKTALDFLERTPEGLGSSDPFLSLLIQANLNGMLGQEPRKLQKHTDKQPSGKVQPSHSEDIKHIKAVMATSQSQNEDSPEECCYLEVEAAAHNVNNSLRSSTSHTDHVETEPGYPKEQEVSDQICNGLYFSNETSVSKKVVVESYSPAPVPERNSSAQALHPSGKSKLALSPTSLSSGLSEVKPSPISSPSRLLKFLKIPPGINQAQPGNPLRLSPQLTRSSKIPCRNNNNYEVYHSPILTRKATTTEREKQPSSSSSKTDPYPATHSAPTSPPKSEDIVDTPPMAKEIAFSSHFVPKPSISTKAPPSSHAQRGSQKVPQYENVCPSDGTPQFLEDLKMSQYLPYPQPEGPVEKQCQQDENLLSPPSSQHPDSSPGTADQNFSDQDTDSESPVWHKPNQHFSLPSSSSSAVSKIKAHSSHPSYSSMRDGHQEHRAAPEPSQQNCEPAQPTQCSARRGDPKRLVRGKTPQSESSHQPFKERLAALGKMKSTEDLPVGAQSVDKKDAQSNLGKPPTNNIEKSKTAERQGERTGAEQHRNQKSTDSLDGKPYPKTSLGSHTRGIGPIHESGTKSSATPALIPKGEQETPFSPRIYVAKAEGPKIKMGTSSSNTETPPVVRSYGKCPITQSHHSKTAPSPQNSPTKVPSKSPSKVGQASSYPRGVKPIPEDRALAHRNPHRPEDKTKLPAGKKKTFGHAESFPPPPPLPPRPSTEAIAKEDKKPYSSGPPVLQSAIEQKVMRGIKENMLKLQEQDQGQVAEPKQKASNGIASWFGLRKSKLPALNRKPEVSKFKINISSSLSSSSASGGGAKDPKTGGPQKVVESLNISKLMEKAEDLRKALEEERAYVNRVGMDLSGRGHSCEVVMDQTQGQLSLMYRGMTAENFMQQLLNSPSTSCSGNRVEERGAIPATFGMTHRRLSFDSKRSRPNFSHQRNGISHTKSRDEMAQGSVMIGKDEVTSEESLAESISSQHFTGSGASMRTLDSGIGTFPMPDYASSMAGKSIPKGKPQAEQGFSCSQGKHVAMMKVPRKAHTLEKELSSLDEVNPFVLYDSGLEGKGTNMHLSSTIHEEIDAYGAHMQNPLTKNWTFPNLKGSAGATDVYLDVQGDLGTPSRRSLKQCAPQRPLATDPGSLPLPLQTGLSRRGKGRTPSASEVGKDGGLELVKERPEDLQSLRETPESLSDSLYDSLSSCGSQG